MSVLYIRDESGKFKAITTITGEKGEKGDPGKDFEYSDFTPEQLESLRGPAGPKGEPGTPVVNEVLPDGTDAVSGAAVAEYVATQLAQAGLQILIKEQPVDVAVEEGKVALFSVKAVGKGLTYQWEYSKDGGGKWVDSSTSTAKTEQVSITTNAAQNGYIYRCKISDANGNTVTSNAAMLTVETVGIVITKQPQSQAAVAGDTVTFHVEATGVASYQWQILGTGGNWNDLTWSGATTATMTHMLNESNIQRQYRCKLTGTDGSVVYTDVVRFTPILITQQPEPFSGVQGDAAVISVEAQGNGLTYQWEYDTGNGWVNNAYEGNQTNAITFILRPYHNGYKYRCKITAADGSVVYTDVVTTICA